MNGNKKKLLWVLSGIMSVSMVAGVASLTSTEVSAAENTPVFSADFEGDLDGFAATGNASATLVTETADLDCAYNGTQAMKVFYNSVCTSMLGSEEDNWITKGDFYELTFWAKVAETTDTYTPVRVAMNYWYMTPENEWKGSQAMLLYPGNTAASRVYVDKGWTQFTTTFGVYGDGTNFYTYNGGTLEKVDALAGYVPAYQTRFDFGSNSNKKSFYCDDVIIQKTAIEKDIVVSVLDGDTGAAVTGATIVVSDSEGNVLATQPTVEENNGVYTVKALSFENFASSYTIQVKKGNVVVGTTQASMMATELSVSTPYTGTVTVKDTDGNFINNATLTYGDVTVTENVDGVYTLANLSSAITVKVSREGLISKIVDVSAANKNVEVVLKEEIPAVEVEDNIIPGGNIDAGFSLPFTDRGIVASISEEDQYEGIKALKLTAKEENGTVEARLGRETALDVSGTKYYYEFIAKSDSNATLTYAMNFVCYKDNGYKSVTFTSEAVELSSEWKLLTMEFSVRYDETTNKVYTTMNGGEEVEFADTVSGLAAVDLRFTLSNGEAFVDNLTLLEMYTATVTVKDEQGNALSGATFELIDHAGRRSAVTPTYDETTGQYTFASLKGVVKLMATAGGKTYNAVTLSRKLNNVEIETAYTINLTLKDQNGNAVIGAKVKARKGVTVVGDFVDNGDGTYTLEGAMGTVSIVIIVNGYDFERQDNVSIANATLTVVGEKYATNDNVDNSSDNQTGDTNNGDQETPKKGCGSFIGAPVTVLALSSMFICMGVRKRKED